MSDLEKYNEVFVKCFRIEVSSLSPSFSIEEVDEWDSLAHMMLVGGLEEVFDVMFDADDIIELSSYENGKTVLGKYGIEV